LTVWNYVYDTNGSLTEVLPNGNEVNSAKRYTYNPAGYLVKVEEHDSSAWNTQSEMSYNGLGERLSVTAYALGQGATTQYVLDAQQRAAPLIASSGGNDTTFLYGLGPIAEKTTAWNYVLPDGSNTPRQLTDVNGEVTLSTRYTPWGDTLELNGTGNFTFGYFGGLMDEATGLIGACPEFIEGWAMVNTEFTLSLSKGSRHRPLPHQEREPEKSKSVCAV
jgi:uncharacterized protein RhaS with RHS repeats